jgi:hypothetical protein
VHAKTVRDTNSELWTADAPQNDEHITLLVEAVLSLHRRAASGVTSV